MNVAVTKAAKNRRKRVRLRTTGGLKPLLCYLLCFALPLLWQWAGLRLVYPYQLANSAPAIADTLTKLFPVRPEALEAAALSAQLPIGGDPALWASTLALRDDHWRLFVAALFTIAWAVTLVLQLWWRIRHSRAINAAKLARRAKRTYRLQLILILVCNVLAAGFLYLAGVQHIAGRNLWDVLVYFPAYGLNVLAAMACFRLAAPPAISGKHAFFKRL